MAEGLSGYIEKYHFGQALELLTQEKVDILGKSREHDR
jgi:hypothetical protein